MEENSSFFALAFRMRYINRWGLMKNSRTENLTEHSAETAMTAHALCVIGNELFGKNYDPEKAAVYALYHDISEIITGDLPTPVKYYSSEISQSYKKLENDAKGELLAKLPEKLRSAYRDIIFEECDNDTKKIIKSADKLSALIKCVDEMKNGNREFASALDSTLEAVKKIELPEVKYFLENMLPPFYLTLDEL